MKDFQEIPLIQRHLLNCMLWQYFWIGETISHFFPILFFLFPTSFGCFYTYTVHRTWERPSNPCMIRKDLLWREFRECGKIYEICTYSQMSSNAYMFNCFNTRMGYTSLYTFSGYRFLLWQTELYHQWMWHPFFTGKKFFFSFHLHLFLLFVILFT